MSREDAAGKGTWSIFVAFYGPLSVVVESGTCPRIHHNLGFFIDFVLCSYHVVLSYEYSLSMNLKRSGSEISLYRARARSREIRPVLWREISLT